MSPAQIAVNTTMLSNKESLIITRIRNLQNHAGQIDADRHPTLRVTGGRDRRGPCVLCKGRDGIDRRVHALVSLRTDQVHRR
jgi:hypothetical protein